MEVTITVNVQPGSQLEDSILKTSLDDLESVKSTVEIIHMGSTQE